MYGTDFEDVVSRKTEFDSNTRAFNATFLRSDTL